MKTKSKNNLKQNLKKTRRPKKLMTSTKQSKNRNVKQGQGRSAKSRTGRKNYFTSETERYVVEYNNEESWVKKNLIFEQKLRQPFFKLAENIINTFKFSYFDNDSIQNVQNDVVSFMVEKIHLYDNSKGKAFSYFSIVAKNYLILSNNVNYKRLKIHDKVDVLDLNRNYSSERLMEDKNHEDKEMIRMIINFWENNISAVFKKKRDIEIAYAVIELFKRIDSIENFNKKALYLLIREMTDCKTQQITKVVNAMRKYYDDMVEEYAIRGDVDTSNIYENRFF